MYRSIITIIIMAIIVIMAIQLCILHDHQDIQFILLFIL
jgi:hypothetical protein